MRCRASSSVEENNYFAHPDRGAGPPSHLPCCAQPGATVVVVERNDPATAAAAGSRARRVHVRNRSVRKQGAYSRVNAIGPRWTRAPRLVELLGEETWSLVVDDGLTIEMAQPDVF